MIENESIAEIFLRVSKKYSNNLALFVENRGYTYKKLRKKFTNCLLFKLEF